jgi:hypothetical protein
MKQVQKIRKKAAERLNRKAKGQTGMINRMIMGVVAVLVGANLVEPVFNSTEEAKSVQGTDGQDDSLIDLIGTLFVVGIALIPVKALL